MNQASTYNTRKWIGKGIYGGAQRLVVILFGIMATMLLAHKAITPYEMGVWSMYQVILAFIEMMRHGFLKNGFIKYANACDDYERESLWVSTFFLNIFSTIGLAIILYFLSGLIASYTHMPELAVALKWNTVLMLALILFSQVEWVALSQTDFKILFQIYLVRQGVTLLLLVVFILGGLFISVNSLVVFYAIGILMGGLYGMIIQKSQWSLKGKYSGVWAKKLFSFGRINFSTSLSNLVFRSSDTFLVSNILTNPIQVALQGIALRIFNLADIPSQLVGDMLFPKSSALKPDNIQSVKYYYEKSTGIVLAIIVPLVLLIEVFAKQIVLILAGEPYLATVPYLRVILLLCFYLVFLKQFGTIMDSTGKQKVNFLFTSFMAVLNVMLCYYMITQFGLMGAAYGLFITYVIAFIVCQYLLNKFYQVEVKNSFKYAILFYGDLLNMLRPKILKIV